MKLPQAIRRDEDMLYIRNESHDPYYNLAFEEYVFRHVRREESIVMLWQNEPSVIVGNFQNTIAEINPEFVSRRGVHVVRRITGGGAVYHDLGNINYSYIVPGMTGEIDLKLFTRPVVDALRTLGLDAEQSGRNDITIGGRKISGNAQHGGKGRVLHHGTLLFNANLEDLEEALRVNADKIQSKGIPSIRSRVTNIAEHLASGLPLDEFKQMLLDHLLSSNGAQEHTMTQSELEGVAELADSKYRTWEWNFGMSPRYNIERRGRLACGDLQFLFQVEHGIITACSIYGDFFSSGDIRALADRFIGTPYKLDELRTVLACIDIRTFFDGISLEDLMMLITPER
jgi:lipoate---protein ligase